MTFLTMATTFNLILGLIIGIYIGVWASKGENHESDDNQTNQHHDK
ncbi:hypothetical protein AKUH3B102A_PHAGE100100 (plasmid) [Apilactobacillus kunkeei]|nr:hypothetical protein AKUH3B102A_PHAGE100100 [Apilactobacillus kunkeei]CAI2700065.1 hypothetical protein AKUH3B107A_PHAGE100100 [Apilactobacillus kunkeei]